MFTCRRVKLVTSAMNLSHRNWTKCVRRMRVLLSRYEKGVKRGNTSAHGSNVMAGSGPRGSGLSVAQSSPGSGAEIGHAESAVPGSMTSIF